MQNFWKENFTKAFRKFCCMAMWPPKVLSHFFFQQVRNCSQTSLSPNSCGILGAEICGMGCTNPLNPHAWKISLLAISSVCLVFIPCDSKNQIMENLTVWQLCFHFRFRSLKLQLGLLSKIFTFNSKSKPAGILEYKVSSNSMTKINAFIMIYMFTM